MHTHARMDTHTHGLIQAILHKRPHTIWPRIPPPSPRMAFSLSHQGCCECRQTQFTMNPRLLLSLVSPKLLHSPTSGAQSPLIKPTRPPQLHLQTQQPLGAGMPTEPRLVEGPGRGPGLWGVMRPRFQSRRWALPHGETFPHRA